MSTIEYSRKGSGPSVVLVHGIGHQRSAWGEVFDQLAQDFDVIAVDLPGFGRSPAPTAPHTWTMDSYVEQLEELFADLGLDRPHVVGNSLGGYFCLQMAARGSARSVTALSPAGFWSRFDLALIATNLIPMKLATYAPMPVLELFARKESLRKITMRALYVHPERVTEQAALSDSLNLRRSPGFWPCVWHGLPLRYIGRPVVPTTIAWGDTDRILSPRHADRARRGLPMVRHASLRACGHVPMLDDPDEVSRQVRQTIAEVDAPHILAS
ncbi:alpha/beta fold hydrolase [Leekyejoonella antrihumi]|uniref:Alpha/beta hydrolase n=1 Tax=Leekyejoonella antrihumi TaxID=1660198 RepID=A0A563E108_9MICO|nr:alpha/beta hydrolase [Leekyejoonella antrihumi]TWP36075.1 alpha/beta hydrolase [Leekyejoonella antrihumi]